MIASSLKPDTWKFEPLYREFNLLARMLTVANLAPPTNEPASSPLSWNPLVSTAPQELFELWVAITEVPPEMSGLNDCH